MSTVRLNRSGYNHARQVVKAGDYVIDEMDQWSEHQPTAEQENAFIESAGIAEFGRWHLGIDDDKPKDTKGHYKFPYGDFKRVHRCGVLAAEVRSGQFKYADIEQAAAHLHGMLDALKKG